MKLEIIGIQLSLPKLSGETCSRRAWAFWEQHKEREQDWAQSYCPLLFLQDSWDGSDPDDVVRADVQPCYAAPPAYVGLEIWPSQVRWKEGFTLPIWTARPGSTSAFCFPGPWWPQTALWIAVSSRLLAWVVSHLLLADKGDLTFVILHWFILCHRMAHGAFELKVLY